MTKEFVKNLLRDVIDFPKSGVHFKDISPVLNYPPAYRYIVQDIVKELQEDNLDIVCGLDARGFLLGPMISDKLDIGFGMIRKAGKLPPPYIVQEYELEYGTDKISASPEIIKPGMRVHLHDDLLGTGGTMEAAIKLVEKLGATVVSISFIIELSDLNGKNKLKNYKYYSFLTL
jgi:adenine phosphoribosyltransferase